MRSILDYAILELGFAIMMTTSLHYVGQDAQPPSPELGAMPDYDCNYPRKVRRMSIHLSLAIFIVVLCINIFGHGLWYALDPKTL